MATGEKMNEFFPSNFFWFIYNFQIYVWIDANSFSLAIA
jgi:hypothetical protein